MRALSVNERVVFNEIGWSLVSRRRRRRKLLARKEKKRKKKIKEKTDKLQE